MENLKVSSDFSSHGNFYFSLKVMAIVSSSTREIQSISQESSVPGCPPVWAHLPLRS